MINEFLFISKCESFSDYIININATQISEPSFCVCENNDATPHRYWDRQQ